MLNWQTPFLDVATRSEWTEYTVTRRTEITGILTDLERLWLTTLTTIGHADAHEDVGPFPITNLTELCPDTAYSPSCKPFLNRDLAKIGSWTSTTGPWEMHLVIAGRGCNPFARYASEAPPLVLIVTCRIPELLDREEWLHADVQVSLEEPNTAKTVDEPWTERLGTMTNERFGQGSTTTCCPIDLTRWTGSLKRWAIRFQHHQCTLLFNITARNSAIRRPDLTGIGKLLQDLPEILDMVASYLDLKDVQRLRAASSTLRVSAAVVAARRLRAALEPYFPEAVGLFCSVLRKHGALVGGSTILSVLRPGNWLPGDLDIVVHGRSKRGMVAFLLHQGFEDDEERGRNNRYRLDILEANNIGFEYMCFTKGDLKIDLCIIFGHMVPSDFVLEYHSTPVMNFFDGRGLFCLFPDLTFNGHYMLNRHTQTRKLLLGVQKIISRGYVEKRPEGGTHLQDWLPHGESGELRFEDLPPIWHQKINL